MRYTVNISGQKVVSANEPAVEKHTGLRLFDRAGHALAKGSKAIAHLLSVGDTLLVTYRVYSDPTMVGDVTIPNYWETALEIRRP